MLICLKLFTKCEESMVFQICFITTYEYLQYVTYVVVQCRSTGPVFKGKGGFMYNNRFGAENKTFF